MLLVCIKICQEDSEINKKYIIADKYVFFMSIIGTIVCFSFVLLIVLLLPKEDQLKGLLLFGSLFLFLLTTEMMITPRWCRWYTFKETEFECNTLFRKKKVIPYDKCHISYASYFQGTSSGLGSIRYYIVFSDRKLSRYEQDNINEANPKGIYKISYSKKTIKKIESVLPAKVFSQVAVIEKIIERLKKNT